MDFFTIPDDGGRLLLQYMREAVSVKIRLENTHGCAPGHFPICLSLLPEGILQPAQPAGPSGVAHRQEGVPLPDLREGVQVQDRLRVPYETEARRLVGATSLDFPKFARSSFRCRDSAECRVDGVG